MRPLTFAALTGQKVITGLFGAASAEETLSSAVEHIRVAQENDLLRGRAGHGRCAREVRARAGRRFSLHLVSGVHRSGGARARHEHQHVESSGHPREHHDAARSAGTPSSNRARDCSPAAPSGPAGWRRSRTSSRPSCRLRIHGHDLDGETVLITAGPTQEALDPVRYITNRSSGKMGYALAEAGGDSRRARDPRLGPRSPGSASECHVVRVRTAVEMRQAVMDHLPESTIIIKSAAVADYHLSEVPTQKRKKTATRLSLELEPTPDILAEAGQKKGDRLLVGFAAETQNLMEEARRKLLSKNCDMVVGESRVAEGHRLRVRRERGDTGPAQRRNRPARARREARDRRAGSSTIS